MKKKGIGFASGLGVGLVSVAALGLAGSKFMKNNKKVRKNAGNAIHAVGDFVENLQYMFK